MTTKPPVLPVWAESGDTVQPTNGEIQEGWPLSNIPPSRQRFNWLLNFLFNGIRYFSRRGLSDYDVDENYMTGDRVIGDDGMTYRSMIDNNLGNAPSNFPAAWERWGLTLNDVGNVAGRVVYTITALRALPKTGTPSAFVLGYYEKGDGGGGAYYLDDVDTVSADNGGTIIVATDGGRWKLSHTGSQISARVFGLKGDGTDEIVKLQAAVDSGKLIVIPDDTTIKTTAPLIIRAGKDGIVGENKSYGDTGSVIDYTGNDSAVKVYDEDTKVVAAVRVENLGIVVRTAGAKALNFQHATYSTFRNIWCRLYAADQTGVYGIGNGLGSAPYYNHFDNVNVFGQGDGANYPGQRGYWFEGDGVMQADGPNSNIISNITRVAGVEVAFDIHSGNGNLLSNICMESIRSYAFKFGYGVGAPGRADGNIVNGARVEGALTCVFAKFEGQANVNTLVNYTSISLSTLLFENNAGYSNFCKPQGNVFVAAFYASDVPANATTKLSPIFTGGEGGILVPFNSIPYSMHVTVNRFASGGAGSGKINFYRSNILNPNLSFTVDGAHRFGGRAVQQAPNRSMSYNAFDSLNGQAQVEIVTDAAWNQTTADVHVQIVFLG